MILRTVREQIVLATIKLFTPNMGSNFEKLYREGLIINQMPRPMIKYLVNLGWTNLVGAEVGVAAGENSANILSMLDVRQLYAVDPYFEKNNNRAIAFALLQNKPVTWFIETSVEASQKIHEPLDFVYIDAAHDYDNVKADIAAWYPHVKVGGVVGGHDFGLSSHDGLIDAVLEFAKPRKLHVYVSCPDWWLIKK